MNMGRLLLCFSALLLCGLSFAGPAGIQFSKIQANPQCPENSHFNSSGNPCPATCENPTAPASCKTSSGVQTCACNDGYILSGNNCVPKSQCGCVYSTDGEKRYLEANQTFWADDNCQTLCTCNPKTKEVDCKASGCPFGQECKILNNITNCYPVSYGTCNIYGDPHYNTFDNTTYDFQGTCTYTAAQSCHLEGTQLKPFAVVVENEKWGKIQVNPNVSMAKVVTVEVNGMILVLRRKQLHQIMVNNVLTSIPVSLDNGEVMVQQDGFQNVITTDFGLRVAYDMASHVSITVPSSYHGKTCGLCGNFNGIKNDELQLPDGKVTKDVTTFGAAWKVAVPGVVCYDGCSGDFCPTCPEDKKRVFEKDCSIITNPQGQFAACHSVIDPQSYFRDCVYDVCVGDGDPDMLCHSIAAYMIDCQDFGVTIENWRTPTFCPLKCPDNSHYEICAQSCDTPCPGLTEIVNCDVQICTEGCLCNSGYFHNGTGCVKGKDCSCYENGQTYKIGESVMTEDCQENLTCLASGEMKHENMSCTNDEVCTVQNGIRDCYPKQCVSGGSPTLHGCVNPQCPANSHFESCGNPCPATCENPTAPASCKTSSCVQTCACNDGYILSGNKCVLKSQCGCVYSADGEKRYLEANQTFWADDNCQTLCTCNPKTKEVDCKASGCPFGQECKILNNITNCYPVSYGTCNIYGDPHYNTFDNSNYQFRGTCTYTAAQGCHLEGTQLKPFAVVVENEKWNEIQSSPNASMAKVVIVEVYGSILVLRRNQLHQLMVNDVLTNIPVNLDNGAVTVQQDGFQNVITTDFGLRVAYDMASHVSITVPSSYHGKTCGLCGNFNGDKNDELQLPDGKVTKDVTTFGAAWKVAVPGVVCDDGCSGDFCPTCPEDKKRVFEKDCSIITNPQGPFAACLSVIDPQSYFRVCVYNVCSSNADPNMLCHSIAAYMIDCQDFGVTVQNWRTPTFCPLKCPDNSHYEICAQSCDTPCPGLTEIINCDDQICAEGCLCNSGFFNNGTGCVKADQCGCYENGQTYMIGETVITDDCSERLTCLSSGQVQHEILNCNSTEICSVRNGVRGCYQKQCMLEAGGSFTFFSGETLTFTSVGAFELVEVCHDTHVYQWFRVVVQLQTCGQTGLSEIAALYLFFEDMLVTVNSYQDIWVNGNNTSDVEKNGISVTEQEGTVIIKKGSGLTVSYTVSEKITVTVSEAMASKMCGACGKLTGKESISINTNKYMNGYRAPDFPQCTR